MSRPLYYPAHLLSLVLQLLVRLVSHTGLPLVELLLSIEIVKEMTFIDRQLVPKRGVGPGCKMGEKGTDEGRVYLMRMIAVPIDVQKIIGAVVRWEPCFGDSSAVAKAKVVTYVVLDDVRESRLLLAL